MSNYLPPAGSDDDAPMSVAAFERFAEALKPAPISAERQAALRARVLQRATNHNEDARAPTEQPGLVTIRGYAEGWMQMLPGVEAKLLHAEGPAQSFLVRLAPGARAPAHDHPAIEECVVLEGSVTYVGGATLRAGDYQLAKTGAHHTELISEHGALVYLRYAQPLENYIKL